MSETHRFIAEVMAITAFIIVINLVGVFIFAVFNQSAFSLTLVSNLLFFELAFLFVVGGCLMSRQPLDEEKRYDENDNPVITWKLAIWGKRIIMIAVLLLVFTIAFALSDILLFQN